MLEHDELDENITSFYFRDFHELKNFWEICEYFNGGKFYNMDNITLLFPDYQYVCFKKVLVKKIKIKNKKLIKK